MVRKHLARPFALKASDDKEGTFSGYGSVFDVVDSWGDVVLKGAFAKSLAAWAEKGKMPALLWQHRSAEPLGVWTKMVEDDRGLYCEGRILLDAGETERRAYAHLKAGSISGLSIGFSLPEGGYEYDSKKGAFLLKEIDLWETSLVTFPANEDAQVDTVKAAIDGGPKEIERVLREAGFSRSQAKGLLARGWDGLTTPREADDGRASEITKQGLSTLIAALGR